MSERKVNPNEVIKYRKKNPCFSGTEIGRHFGISSQRTNIILKGAGVKTTSTKWGKSTICPVCKEKKAWGSSICGKCYKDAHNVPLICDQCGKIFIRQQSKVLTAVKNGQTKVFCNNKHKGQYLGETHGFRIHPENRSKFGGNTPKVDQANIIDLFKAGYKQIEISDLTGDKYATVHYTLFKSELGKKENFPKVR